MTPTQEKTVDGIADELSEKYGKKYEIESEPKNYVHEGQNSAEFLSHFVSDIRKALTTYAAQQVRLREDELQEVIESGKYTPVDAARYIQAVKDAKHPFDDGYNLGREEAYEHVLALLTKPK